MAKRKKNEVDPNAPPVPQWKPPTEDIEWRDWMKTTIWGSDDIITFGTKLSVPFIFPLPFFSAPESASLQERGKGAGRSHSHLRAPSGPESRRTQDLGLAQREEEEGVPRQHLERLLPPLLNDTDEELEEQGMGMFFGGGEEYPGGDDHSGGESSGDD
tara:strand:+ start:645 stop:1118 length:474 start_codon:yes stop_codon:yes gene_type:complete